MALPVALTADSFLNPQNLLFEELLLVSFVYTVVLVVLGYVGAVLWQRWRGPKKAS